MRIRNVVEWKKLPICVFLQDVVTMCHPKYLLITLHVVMAENLLIEKLTCALDAKGCWRTLLSCVPMYHILSLLVRSYLEQWSPHFRFTSAHKMAGCLWGWSPEFINSCTAFFFIRPVMSSGFRMFRPPVGCTKPSDLLASAWRPDLKDVLHNTLPRFRSWGKGKFAFYITLHSSAMNVCC